MSIVAPAVSVENVTYRYGDRTALDGVSLEIQPGEAFVFLGPNGGGKTTLFRLLTTLVAPQSGSIALFGRPLPRQAVAARLAMGVVFQAPSVDRHLTVQENLRCQGALYGLGRSEMQQRGEELLIRFRLQDRAWDRASTLSGGLRRRLELAKALLHRPGLLLLDEPTAGLDPLARIELWQYLHDLRAQDGITIVSTTHLLEEADKADRIAILDRGRIVALDTPAALRSSVAGASITITTSSPGELAAEIQSRFSLAVQPMSDSIRLRVSEGPDWVGRLMAAFPTLIESITLGKATLEDVFVDRTGHSFATADDGVPAARSRDRH